MSFKFNISHSIDKTSVLRTILQSTHLTNGARTSHIIADSSRRQRVVLGVLDHESRGKKILFHNFTMKINPFHVLRRNTCKQCYDMYRAYCFAWKNEVTFSTFCYPKVSPSTFLETNSPTSNILAIKWRIPHIGDICIACIIIYIKYIYHYMAFQLPHDLRFGFYVGEPSA